LQEVVERLAADERRHEVIHLMKRFWCYIMSNKSRRLYTGFTNDLGVRVMEHKRKLYPSSFTAQYVFDMLVFYEEYSSVIRAKIREKEIKGWRREKKLELILSEIPIGPI
jgi:putative endonuclease